MALDAASTTDKPYNLVKPIDWQKAIFKNEKPIYKATTIKKKSKDTKAMAALVVHRLFPDETFQRTERTTKPHDGMIDAALIAYWGANFRGRG